MTPALVLADAVAENTASVRILERLGFVRTAVHPGAFCREGRTLDIWDYVLRWDGRNGFPSRIGTARPHTSRRNEG